MDLPESAALRTALLPRADRQRLFAGSALDPAWTELVDRDRGVLITAQGLLMYLQPEQVRAVVGLCAGHFPGATLVFDAVPRWMAGLVRRGVAGYQPPPLPWTVDSAGWLSLRSWPRGSSRCVTSGRQTGVAWPAGSGRDCATCPYCGTCARSSWRCASWISSDIVARPCLVGQIAVLAAAICP